ncbi:MAG: PD-(D/E)XK nuclease family protein, partial [Bacillota bacterium]|nr:PD-(D/E)XK nuclease family protein [Bacillota bacterium]
VIEKEDFDLLLNHVRKNIRNVGNEIIDGNISHNPLKINQQLNACDYCDYSGICQFDKQLIKNKYRTVNNYSDKEIIELLNSNKEIKDK